MTYDPNDPERPRVVETHRVVTERPANTTGWFVAAIVAVVAIIAVAFMVYNRPGAATDDQQIANAVEQGRMQGAMDAQAQLNAQSNAAAQAQMNAQITSERAAMATQQAAAEARAAADQAAASVADAARDANDRIAAQNAGEPAPMSPSPR